ncbi:MULTISPECIES: hydrogenase expression/formation protein HypE [Caldilinea]|uniref:Hydrogenase expression/formation protein HypE n=1 Tax=Caldilinea aerophila (strain DSM 14535 / JCM 11387 / NBRC 104270 / STL-6-O1) TaxID=926550 RepID=I0I5E2_CALAS|nr:MULTISPECIES: hydrogenase expression/formation protein HypE [Caldilinea]BAM00480.1 hydrogenase expression/formation protein HypE [Caldilinea aerophila DSM 14535 = NBRC 104270]GIV71830.1 MAG: hydrogenase expression/formation protein HypE [Caldilinea sp.]
MIEPIDFTAWSCPLPLRSYPTIVMGHGGGGKLSAELVEHLFAPAFRNAALDALGDAAVLTLEEGGRLAYSTDSFVVRPLFFPGGNIGKLAVNGTVNDLAMMGAKPRYLTAGFILEEGLLVSQLGVIVEEMAAAARTAGVQIVAGDTKVVDRGHGDGVYINTSGVGIIPDGIDIRPQRAQPGDVVIVSGEIGLHGVAILSVREGLEFGAPVESDCAPLNGLVEAMLAASHAIHVLRDPTRGGLAATLNEIARAARVGVVYEERKLPVPPAVAAACEMLGMDPVYIANEGKLVAVVAPEAADVVLEAMQRHPLGAKAAIIGRITAEHPGVVVARTGIGGSRVVDMQVGEQLPRIC